MTYTEIHKIAYDFHKKWATPPHTKEEWDRCCNDMQEAYQKADSDFLYDILTCIYRELLRRSKATENATKHDSNTKERVS